MDVEGTGFNPSLSQEDIARINMQVDTYNKTLNTNGRQVSQSLGKDDFLKLLITQLSNQDPTDPMDNTQFIAQMAQFSSLEQMTNMNSNFETMNSILTTNSAINTLGKTVDIVFGDMMTTGVVDAVSGGTSPQIEVNGMFYDMSRISAVYDN